MSPDTRDAIQKFVDEILDFFSDFDVEGYPVDVERIVELLNGQVLDDLEYPMAKGRIEYVKDQKHEFVIHINNIQEECKRRFTIAHELGHLFLHMDFFDKEAKKKHTEYQDCIFYRKDSAYTEEELYADEFAASLLMPRDEFRKVAEKHLHGITYDITQIAEYFGVSLKAVWTRGLWLRVFAPDKIY